MSTVGMGATEGAAEGRGEGRRKRQYASAVKSEIGIKPYHP